jgi:hypothetical protein
MSGGIYPDHRAHLRVCRSMIAVPRCEAECWRRGSAYSEPCSLGSEVECDADSDLDPRTGPKRSSIGRCSPDTGDRPTDPRHRKSPAQAHDQSFCTLHASEAFPNSPPDQTRRRRGLSPIAVTSTQLLPAASGEKNLGNRVIVEREAGGTKTVRVCAQVKAPGDDAVKGAFIQIMPLTWDSFPPARHGQAPRAHDLTGSTSGPRRGSLSKT